MGEPVKLSRERWRLLTSIPEWGKYGDLLERIQLEEAREIDGVIFLPAEYVPASEPSWQRTAYSPVKFMRGYAQDHDPR